jgi:hypothetical protein
LKSSDNSSVRPSQPLSGSTPPRRSFALTGHSTELDPRTNAVRKDLADVRLADLVFAPHYAAPLLRTISTPASLRESKDHDSERLTTLEPGEVFEVLELAGDNAWGKAVTQGLVGYIDATALADPS